MPASNDDSIVRKLLRRPSSVIALLIIGITCFVALFAYLLAPDNTPNANRLIVELGAKQPGFTKQLLLVPKVRQQQRQARIIEWFEGTSSDYLYIPLNSYHFNANNLVINHYIDDGLEDTLIYPLAELLPKERLSTSVVQQQQYIIQHR